MMRSKYNHSWQRLVVFALVGVIASAISYDYGYAQLSGLEEGTNWQKTLRLRGIMNKYDPFNDSKLYQVTAENKGTLGAERQYVQFEMLASDFWVIMRDSLERAIQDDEVDAYTLSRIGGTNDAPIMGKGTKVTYSDLLDTLSTNLQEMEAQGRFMLNFQISQGKNGVAQPQDRVTQLMLNNSTDNRLVSDLSQISMYELEVIIRVDETGFSLKPKRIFFSTTHWGSANELDMDNLMSGFTSGMDYNSVGFMIDLTDEKTLSYLVENGLQFTGEENIVPYYDLIALFHYGYKVHAESNNVVALGANSFGYDLEELEQTLLNRYNDLTYTYLYGEPPRWWEEGAKGSFTNGMYEIPDTVDEQENQNQQQ
ncbi:MAG: hypothetical protein ACQETE_06035 [Bacteroidota bacterium]